MYGLIKKVAGYFIRKFCDAVGRGVVKKGVGR